MKVWETIEKLMVLCARDGATSFDLIFVDGTEVKTISELESDPSTATVLIK